MKLSVAAMFHLAWQLSEYVELALTDLYKKLTESYISQSI